jgi:type VI secretion system secreted protein VgrG
VHGTTYVGGSVALQAQTDALAAYNILSGEAGTSIGPNLGELTLLPGVYRVTDAAQLTGILTLSGTGDFVFQIGTLTTATDSSVQLINGAQAGNVFWQVGTSATLGLRTSFYGSILADQSITMNTGASMDGRALALNGAVTLDGNTITAVPEAAALWPLVFCASIIGAWKYLAVWRRNPESFRG